MSMPLKWEFPGGKIEAGESPQDCLKREIKEELDVEIAIGQLLTPNLYRYEAFMIELIPYLAEITVGSVILNEHSKKIWSSQNGLLNYDWAAADIKIVQEVINLPPEQLFATS